MLALSRFINRRRTPDEIFSDNGSNFVGAEPMLRDLLRNWDHNDVESRLACRGIRWRFNPPDASHHGGVWERLVQFIKRILHSVAGNSSMTDKAFNGYLVEVERMMNGRHLTSVSFDPWYLSALSPNAFLTGSLVLSVPLRIFLKAYEYRRSWKRVSMLADQFWTRWLREYCRCCSKGKSGCSLRETSQKEI